MEMRINLLLKMKMMWWWNPQERKVRPQVVPLIIPTAQKHSLRQRLMLEAPRLGPLKATWPFHLKRRKSSWVIKLLQQEKAQQVTPLL